jgi:hypothetical protein
LDFIVIDTEGKPELREVAILNSQGTLIYEAFSAAHLENHDIRHNLKPLPEIVQEIAVMSQKPANGKVDKLRCVSLPSDVYYFSV